MQKVICPHCGYENSTAQYTKTAWCAGVTIICKNKRCKRPFEIKIKGGKQVI